MTDRIMAAEVFSSTRAAASLSRLPAGARKPEPASLGRPGRGGKCEPGSVFHTPGFENVSLAQFACRGGFENVSLAQFLTCQRSKM